MVHWRDLVNTAAKEVSKRNRCECCGEDSSSRLSRCSRCCLVSYCARECQKNDIWNHKSLCKEIARREKVVKAEGEKLKSCVVEWDDSDEPRNLFETSAGYLGQMGPPETYEYINARAELAKVHTALAYKLKHPTLSIWNKAASEYQECLRLCGNDEAGLGCVFPFTLIHCNRDDDAYAFARWRVGDSSLDWEHHLESKEGDWVWPYENEDPWYRYRDFFEETGESGCDFLELGPFVAVLLVKFRLIADFDAKKQRCGTEITEEEANLVEDVRSKQTPALLDAIHSHNPTMLPSLINPGPLLEQPPPPLSAHGKPSEAWFTLMDAIGPFNRIHGARDLLVERFGSNPTYDTNCDTGLFRQE